MTDLYALQTYHKSWGRPHSRYLEENVQAARRSCRLRIQGVDYEDLDQELYLKALEFDEIDHIERPGFVYRSLMNKAMDIARKETMYKKRFDIGMEDSEELMNFLDYEFEWTSRLLGAALVAFITHPHLLSPIVKDEVYIVYKKLNRREHDTLIQYIFGDRSPALVQSFYRLSTKYVMNMKRIESP